MAPNWVPLSFRCPLLPTPLSTAIPDSQAQLFQPQSLMGSKGLAQHSYLHPCPGLLESAEPCSQASLSCQNGATWVQAVLQKSVSEAHPHLSTLASITLVQGLSPWTHPSPDSALSNLMETTATCNLFQGWLCTAVPRSNALRGPHKDCVICVMPRILEWRNVRKTSTLSSNLCRLSVWASGLDSQGSKLQKGPKSSGTRY